MADLKTLARGLKDTDPARRRKTIQQLAQSNDPDALKYLAWAYKNDPDDNLRQLALRGGKYLRKRVRDQEDVAGYETDSGYDTYEPVEAEPDYSYYDSPDQDTDQPDTYDPVDEPPSVETTAPAQPAPQVKIKTRRQADGMDGFLGLMSLLLLVGFFASMMVPQSYWVDLSDIPMAYDGTTFGAEIERIKAEWRAESPGDWVNKVHPGFNGLEAFDAISGNSNLGTELLLSEDYIRNANVRGLNINANAYYPAAEQTSSILEATFLVIIIGWLVFSVLILAQVLPSRTAFGFIGELIVNVINRTLGTTLVWFLLMVVNLIAVGFVGWFFLESVSFTPEVVWQLALFYDPNYTIGQELGTGFWLTAGITLVSFLIAMLGFLGVLSGKPGDG